MCTLGARSTRARTTRIAGKRGARPGWKVVGFDANRVYADAAALLGTKSIDTLLRETRKALGASWQIDHEIAMAASGSASRTRGG